jgi:hypothetical protein
MMCTPEDINRYLLEMLETLKILTWYCQKFWGGSFEEMAADVGMGLYDFLRDQASEGHDPLTVLEKIKSNSLSAYERSCLFGKIGDLARRRRANEFRHSSRTTTSGFVGIASTSDRRTEMMACVWEAIARLPAENQQIIVQLMYREQSDKAFRIAKGWSRGEWERRVALSRQLFATTYRKLWEDRSGDGDIRN